MKVDLNFEKGVLESILETIPRWFPHRSKIGLLVKKLLKFKI